MCHLTSKYTKTRFGLCCARTLDSQTSYLDLQRLARRVAQTRGELTTRKIGSDERGRTVGWDERGQDREGKKREERKLEVRG